MDNCVGELEGEAKAKIWRPDPYVFNAPSFKVLELIRGRTETTRCGFYHLNYFNCVL